MVIWHPCAQHDGRRGHAPTEAERCHVEGQVWVMADSDGESPGEMVHEVALGGGRTTTGVVQIGDSVHRPARPWTASVHAVLRHLEAAGFQGAPRVLGFDESGREVLAFMPGETVGERLPWPEWVGLDETLVQVGEWLRRLHDVMVDFSPPDDAIWFSGRPWSPGLVVGHHDAAPYNAVWRDGRLVGFIDWDTAGPSSAAFDLAYSALLWVPMVSPGSSSWPLAFCAPDDRARRLHLLLDAYGWAGDRQSFGSVLATRARVNAQFINGFAASQDPAYMAIRQQADDLERSARDIEALSASFWKPPGSA
jgi:hypothetical protein